MKRTLLLLAVILCIAGFAVAQQQWQLYTNGKKVNAIAEEGNILWIGTGGGLVELDKTTGIPVFYNNLNSGLPCNEVTSIAIDTNGTKWIGTMDGGMAQFDGTNWTTYNTNNSGILNDRINTIIIAPNGVKLIAPDSHGLVKFDGTNWISYNYFNSSLPDDRISSIAIDTNGTLWIGTQDGLAAFDGINLDLL